jgi:hypothetical protein
MSRLDDVCPLLLPLTWPPFESRASCKQKHRSKNTRYVGVCREQAKKGRAMELDPRIGRVERARLVCANRSLPSFWTLGTAAAGVGEALSSAENSPV